MVKGMKITYIEPPDRFLYMLDKWKERNRGCWG